MIHSIRINVDLLGFTGEASVKDGQTKLFDLCRYISEHTGATVHFENRLHRDENPTGRMGTIFIGYQVERSSESHVIQLASDSSVE